MAKSIPANFAPTLDRVIAVYDKEANHYDLTRIWKISSRRKAVEALQLEPGQKVLEVGCGTGENFADLEARIGANGKIIGVEVNTNMLAIARRKIKKRRYQNVELYQDDAAAFTPQEEVDAVLFSDVLFIIPEYRKAMENAISKLRTGGRVVILGFKTTESPWLSYLNQTWTRLSNNYGGDFSRTPWKDLQEMLGIKPEMKEYWLGFRYIATGIKL